MNEKRDAEQEEGDHGRSFARFDGVRFCILRSSSFSEMSAKLRDDMVRTAA